MEQEQTYRSVKVLEEGDQQAKEVKMASDVLGRHHDSYGRGPTRSERGCGPYGLE